MWFAVGYFVFLFVVVLLLLSPLVAAEAVLAAPKRPRWWGWLLPGGWLLAATGIITVLALTDASAPPTWHDTATGILSRWFLLSLPALAMLAVFLIRRLQGHTGWKVLAVALTLALIPVPVTCNCGKLADYCAILYRISIDHHETTPLTNDPYTTVYFFPLNFLKQEGR